MKKINLRGVSETLNEREMKDVRGGEWGEPPVIDFDTEPGSEDSGNNCNWYRCMCTLPLSPIIIKPDYPIVQAPNIVEAVAEAMKRCPMYGSIGCSFDRPCS